MELDHALQILDLVGCGGAGRAKDVKKNPRAIGLMGLALFEVEMDCVCEARETIEKYLEKYPEADRARIRTDLYKDFRDIQNSFRRSRR